MGQRVLSFLHFFTAERVAVTLFGLAFFVSVFPVFGSALWGLGVAVSALVVTLLGQLCDRKEQPALSREGRSIAALVYGVFGLGVVSLLFSEMPYDGVTALAVMALLPLSFAVTLRFWRRVFVRPAFGFVLSVFAVLCGFVIAQYFMLGADRAAFAVWPLGSNAGLGALLAAGFLLVFGLFLRSGMPLYRAVYGVMLVVAFLSVVMTGSAAALLGLFAALVVVCAALWGQVRAFGFNLIAALLLCIVAAVCLLVFAGPEEGVLAEQYTWQGWAAALQIMLDYPLLGTGAGTFIYYYPEYRLSGDLYDGFIARNDVLQLTAELGVLFPLLFYGLAAACAVYTRRALRVLGVDDPRHLQLVVYSGILLVLFFALHGGGAFYAASVLMLLGLVLGAWLCLVMEVLHSAGVLHQRVMPDGARMALAFGLVLALSFMWAQLGGHIYVAKAQHHLALGELESAGLQVNAADRFAQGTNVQAIVMAANIHIGTLQDRRSGATYQLRQVMAQEATALLAQAEKLNPRLTSIPLSYALLARFGADVMPPRYQERPYLRAVLDLNPEYLEARLRLAELLRLQGDLQGGLALLVEGLDLVYPGQNPLFYYAAVLQAAQVMSDPAVQERAARLYVEAEQRMRRKAERDFALAALLARVTFWR